MKIGDIVRVDKCEACEAIVGKTGKIKCFVDSIYPEQAAVLNFGKGRPQKGRPHAFPVGDLTNELDQIAEVHV